MELLVDTCSYIAPVLRPSPLPVMTDSGKWAFYAPGNIGVGGRLRQHCGSASAPRSRGASGGTRTSGARHEGQVARPGAAAGAALVLDEPLSLWGGVDPATRRASSTPGIRSAANRWPAASLVMPAVRGSSSSSSILAEAIRAGSAPAAILLGEPDLILAVGAAVAEELYGRRVPVVVLAPDELAGIADGARVMVDGADVTLA